ncbi:MAG: hypothetical protein KC486_28585, partial [Myxococcales bacterium]|nr:hypothetical protein [Myxococcales bacterium]
LALGPEAGGDPETRAAVRLLAGRAHLALGDRESAREEADAARDIVAPAARRELARLLAELDAPPLQP